MRQRDVFRFWLPLFASWSLMTLEGPLVSAAVNRLADEVVMLAALGIVVSLSVAIESPIINLLATATALVEDRASYLQVRRFTVHWMLLLTAAAAWLAWGSLFDLVIVRWMETPAEVARWVRVGLGIMVPWTAAIAWRRFLQGVMIHFGRTRPIAWGTALRLAVSAGTAVGLAMWGGWPGVQLAAVALLAGVVAEALFATWAVRPILNNELALDVSSSAAPLDYRALLAYHMPLASTSMLTLFAQPLVSLALARLDRPTASLAAWPLVFQLTLLARSMAFALPEVVIALERDAESAAALRRFAITLTWVSLGSMALLVATPLIDIYLIDVQSAAPSVAERARLGLTLLLPMPAMVVVISWLRGRLMRQRRTRIINRGMIFRLAVFVPVLFTGVVRGWPGIPTASLAVVLSVAVEMGYILVRARHEPSIAKPTGASP